VHHVGIFSMVRGMQIQVLIPDVYSMSINWAGKVFWAGHFKTDTLRSKTKLHTHLCPAHVQLLSLAHACCTRSKIRHFWPLPHTLCIVIYFVILGRCPYIV